MEDSLWTRFILGAAATILAVVAESERNGETEEASGQLWITMGKQQWTYHRPGEGVGLYKVRGVNLPRLNPGFQMS